MKNIIEVKQFLHQTKKKFESVVKLEYIKLQLIWNILNFRGICEKVRDPSLSQ